MLPIYIGSSSGERDRNKWSSGSRLELGVKSGEKEGVRFTYSVVGRFEETIDGKKQKNGVRFIYRIKEKGVRDII